MACRSSIHEIGAVSSRIEAAVRPEDDGIGAMFSTLRSARLDRGCKGGGASGACALPRVADGRGIGLSAAPVSSPRAEPMRPVSGGLSRAVLQTPVSAFAAVGFAMLAVLLLASAASASGWSVQPAAKPASKYSVLNSVSCTSRTVCVAVGYFKNKSFLRFALVERWNGVRWSIQPNPAGSRTVLNGVSCTSATACTAVGARQPLQGHIGSGAPLVEHWDGSSWSIQPISRFADGSLSAISCPSKTFCAAVGSWGGQFGESPLLLGRWNGRTWSFRTIGFGEPASPYGVSCVSAAFCEAVGAYFVVNGASDPAATWDWNGKRWAADFNPFQGAASPASLASVSCSARTTCVAVGNGAPTGASLNGSAWSTIPAANPAGAVNYPLTGISCPSDTACTAVGGYQTDYVHLFRYYVLIEGWNGSSWSVELAGSLGQLESVSCVSPTACTAVGSTTNGAGERVPLVESTIHSASDMRS